MADDYQFTTLAGTAYLRTRAVYIETPHGAVPSALIKREELQTLEGRPPRTTPFDEIVASIDEFPAEYPLRNPLTNDLIPDQTGTMEQLQVLLFSAIWALFEQHDQPQEIQE